MVSVLKKIVGDKAEWRAMEARAESLPSDYRIVYTEIKKYVWKFTAGDGMDIVAMLKDLLGLFETGAADGRRALEVTGDDVAAFCDDLLRNVGTYTDRWRTTLNNHLSEQLGGEQPPR